MKLRDHAFILLLVVLNASLHVLGQSPLSREEKALRDEISRHDRLYYKENAPEISDREYDLLRQRLWTLNEQTTPAIGDDRNAGDDKAFHRSPMLSLAKSHGEKDLQHFQQRIHELSREKPVRLVIEPKIDGMAINLVYVDGRLNRAISRGNGRVGDVLTQNVLKVAGVPEYLEDPSGNGVPDYIEIRGEIYIEKADFERMNRDRILHESREYATPRSFAAGSMRLEEAKEVRERCLQLTVFDYGSWSPRVSMPKEHLAFIEQAKQWGFHVPESAVVDSSRDLASKVETELKRYRHSQIPCDGVVIKVNDRRYREKMGCSKVAPNWAIACKFKPVAASSIVNNIELQVGRTGRVTPVAIINPVKIGNRTIQRINLHSARYVAAKDIRIGDHVAVEFSGDVIPLIGEVDRDARTKIITPYTFPEACPYCGTRFTRNAEEVTPYCPHYRCPERTRRRLEYFADVIGLNGLGSSGISRLVDSATGASFKDLLQQDKALLEIVKSAPEWKILAALGIPGIGPSSARIVAQAIDCLEELLDIENLKLESMGISSGTRDSIIRYFRDSDAKRDLVGLIQAMLN